MLLALMLLSFMAMFQLPVSPVHATGITRVQGNCKGTGTSSPIVVNMTNTPISGDILIAVVGVYASSSPSTPSVSGITETGVSWSRQVDNFSAVSYLDVEIWVGVVGSGALKGITISIGVSITQAIADVCEYSGLLTSGYLDKTAGTNGDSNSPNTGTTSTTTQSFELWIGGITTYYASLHNPTNGFTLLDGLVTGYLERIATSTGNAYSGASMSSNYWVGCIATLKAVSATDNVPPNYSNIAYNTTTFAKPCLFSCMWSDRYAGLSVYKFCWNGSGSFVNITGTFSNNPAWANVTETLPSTVFLKISFEWYANDTLDNWNSTSLQTFTVTSVSLSGAGYISDTGIYSSIWSASNGSVQNVPSMTLIGQSLGNMSWQQLAYRPSGLIYSGPVFYNADGIPRIYVFGGRDQSSNRYNFTYCYFIGNNSWVKKAYMPDYEDSAAVGLIGNCIYVAGGFGLSEGEALQIYNITSNTWTLGPDYPGAVYDGEGAVVNGSLYVVGGTGGSTSTKNLYCYNPTTNHWSQKASSIYYHAKFACAVYNNRIYAFDNGFPASQYNNTVEYYNYTTNSWTPLNNSPLDFSLLASATVGTKIYLAFGMNLTTDLACNYIWQYDPTTDTYQELVNSYLNEGPYGPGPTALVGLYLYEFACNGSSVSTGAILGKAATYKYPLSYSIYRTFLFFNATIPASSSITSAVLALYGAQNNSTNTFSIAVQSGEPTYPHKPLIPSDYNKTHYSGCGGILNTANFTVGAYNYVTLNATGIGWINKTGLTKLCLRSLDDISGLPPVGYELVGMWTSFEAASYKPKLLVTYLSATINATSVVMDRGQSKTFASSVSGGNPPYTYHWYLNGSSKGGNTTSWTFTPSSTGYYTIYVNVTDSNNQRSKSNVASVTVNNVPSPSPPAVGGVWVPVDKLALLAPYIALASTILAATAATGIYVKRRKEKQ
jgi:hypothetical protein